MKLILNFLSFFCFTPWRACKDLKKLHLVKLQHKNSENLCTRLVSHVLVYVLSLSACCLMRQWHKQRQEWPGCSRAPESPSVWQPWPVMPLRERLWPWSATPVSVWWMFAASSIYWAPLMWFSCAAPGPVSNLSLVTTYDSLTATWHPLKCNYSFFTIELQLNGTRVEIIHELFGPRKHFSRLKTAANYTVIIYIVNGGLKGPPVKQSKFTCESLFTLFILSEDITIIISIMLVNMLMTGLLHNYVSWYTRNAAKMW